MADFIVVIMLLAIVGAAVFYLIKEKKNGVKCIGCSEGVTCSHNCGSCGGCGSTRGGEAINLGHTDTKE